MQILHLDSSIQGNGSVSRRLSAAVVQSLCEGAPQAAVVRRDLVVESIPHLDGSIASGFRDTGVHENGEYTRTEHARSEELVTEPLASDVVVIGAPMYNFSVPTQLKAWIDRIVQAGRTFQFSPSGAVGKASSIRAVIASARGGAYDAAHADALDFQERYLRAVFGFIGIRDIRFVRAEGTKGPNGERAIEEALRSIYDCPSLGLNASFPSGTFEEVDRDREILAEPRLRYGSGWTTQARPEGRSAALPSYYLQYKFTVLYILGRAGSFRPT